MGLLDGLVYKFYEITDGIADRREQKKEIVYCSTQDEFNRAIEKGIYNIVICDSLYREMEEIAKKDVNSSKKATYGLLSAFAGFSLGGPIGLVLMGGGIVSAVSSKTNEKLIDYVVKIDETEKRIYLKRTKVKND